MSSITNDLALIRLVEQHKHLYDRLEPLYKNKAAVEKTWLAISKILKIPADDCQRRWCVIRNRYAKEKRLQNDPNAIQPKGSWPCMDALGFLATVVKPRRSFGMTTTNFLPDISPPSSKRRRSIETIIVNYDDSIPEDSWIKTENNEHESVEMEESGCGSSISTMSSTPSYISVRKMSSDLKEDKAESAPKVETQDETDADYNFCLSLHKSLKELNKKYNMKAKIEILQVIDKYQNLE